MERSSEIKFWLDAANRRESEGNPAAAISFRNIAWLLEHNNLRIKAPVLSAPEQAKNYCSKSIGSSHTEQ